MPDILKQKNPQTGAALLIVLVFVSTALIALSALLGYTGAQIVSHRHAVSREQALNIAEAGAEMAIWQLNQTGAACPGACGTPVPFAAGEYTVATADSGTAIKIVTVTSYVPNHTNPIVSRIIKFKAGKGITTLSLPDGVQAGSGGVYLEPTSSGPVIHGSVYSNGDITGCNSTDTSDTGCATGGASLYGSIENSAVAANPPALGVDQLNPNPAIADGTNPPSSITFGNSVSGPQDFAQSFQLASPAPLHDIKFYMRKVGAGTPSAAYIRITTSNSIDNAEGFPSANTSSGNFIMMDTTTTIPLSASVPAISGSWQWVKVAMPDTPVLGAHTTYWIVIDLGGPGSTYYEIGTGPDSSYSYINNSGIPGGTAKTGTFSTTSNWTSPSPAKDAYFQISTGATATDSDAIKYSTIAGQNASVNSLKLSTVAATGNVAWAHTVNNATVQSGTLQCIANSKTAPSTCSPPPADPVAKPFPITDTMIQKWKNDAFAGGYIGCDLTGVNCGSNYAPYNIAGSHNGYTVSTAGDVLINQQNNSPGVILGPGMIKGDLEVGVLHTPGAPTNVLNPLILTGTLWVKGSVDVNRQGKILLDDTTYGSTSGVLVADGIIGFTQGGTATGSYGTASFPFLISTSACPEAPSPNCQGSSIRGGTTAIYFDGSNGAGQNAVFFAPNGTLRLFNATSINQVSAKEIIIQGSATVDYSTLLRTQNIQSGINWLYLPGTYQIVQ